MSLLEFFEQHNPGPHVEIERQAVIAFEKRLKDPNWRPANPYYGGFLPIVEIGVLAGELHAAAGAESKLPEIIDRILTDQARDKSLLAELHTGALLTRLGERVSFPARAKEPGQRMPDLILHAEAGPVDVEVVRGEPRQGHQEHRDRMRLLSEVIGTFADKNLAIFIADHLDEQMMETIVCAVINVTAGDQIEAADRWCVVAGPPGERDRFVAGREQLKPKWWPDAPSFWNMSGQMGGASNNTATLLTSPVPLESYLNPIRRKAERPQRTGDYPYLIALDYSELPGASARLQAELNQYFQQWPHVSGVLVHQSLFTIQSWSWWRALFRNPAAQLPLPDVVLPEVSAERGESHIVPA